MVFTFSSFRIADQYRSRNKNLDIKENWSRNSLLCSSIFFKKKCHKTDAYEVLEISIFPKSDETETGKCLNKVKEVLLPLKQILVNPIKQKKYPQIYFSPLFCALFLVFLSSSFLFQMTNISWNNLSTSWCFPLRTDCLIPSNSDR